MIKIFLLVILLLSSSVAIDKLYFLPKDSKKVQKDMEELFKNAKESIEVAIYNISDRKIVEVLNDAANRGIKVKLYFYKKKAELSDKIDAVKVMDKLHTKLAIVDKKIVIFGSANWTSESFSENYEVIYISDKEKIVEEFNSFYKTIKKDK